MQRASPLLALKLKVVVSDPAVTARITAPFAWLFRPLVVVPVLVAFAAVVGWVLFEKGLASGDPAGLRLPRPAARRLPHHRAVGRLARVRARRRLPRRGRDAGAMGAGLYLVWPAFYTDVDDSYRLPRRGRLVVDLGGLYFNAVAGGRRSPALWSCRARSALLLLVAAQLLLMLRQLAPVVRADGYHMLADLTGVPDLFRHIGPTLEGLLPWQWGQPQPLRP